MKHFFFFNFYSFFPLFLSHWYQTNIVSADYGDQGEKSYLFLFTVYNSVQYKLKNDRDTLCNHLCICVQISAEVWMTVKLIV